MVVNIENHFLVPKHTLIPKEAEEELLKKLNADKRELPLILKQDPAIKKLKAKSGDIVKIVRKSPTAGESIYYRVVK